MNKIEFTLALIKPDAMMASQVGDITETIKDSKLHIVLCQRMRGTRDLFSDFYAEHKGKPFFDGLIDHMCSGHFVAMVLCGEDAVTRWRGLMGATDPMKAAPGTLRAKHGTVMPKNAVHGSDSVRSAMIEIKKMFPGQVEFPREVE
jgi:nucleoside-diphosphate kinase